MKVTIQEAKESKAKFDLFVEQNIKLIHYTLKKFFSEVRYGTDAYDDLFQVGAEGLIKATLRFDDSFNAEFSTYAIPTIRGTIYRYQRDYNNTYKVPRSLKETYYRAKKLSNSGYTDVEICKALAVSGDQLDESRRALQEPIRLDYQILSDDSKGTKLHDVIPSDYCLEDVAIANADLDLIIKLLRNTIPETECLVFEQRLKGLTQSEIGELYGLTQVQVSRVLRKIIKWLQRKVIDTGANEEIA